jgi:hypothetical protein
MPVTHDQNTKILAYAQAGMAPQQIYEMMHQIGDHVPKSTLYKHLVRMRGHDQWQQWERAEGVFFWTLRRKR